MDATYIFGRDMFHNISVGMPNSAIVLRETSADITIVFLFMGCCCSRNEPSRSLSFLRSFDWSEEVRLTNGTSKFVYDLNDQRMEPPRNIGARSSLLRKHVFVWYRQ